MLIINIKCTSVLLQCCFPQLSGYHCIGNAPLVTKNFGLFEVAGITTWLWYVKLYTTDLIRQNMTFHQTENSKHKYLCFINMYKAVFPGCVYFDPLDRFASNFDLETHKNHVYVLGLAKKPKLKDLTVIRKV